MKLSTYSQFGNLIDTAVISDVPNYNNNLVFSARLLHQSIDFGDANWGSVDSRHKQSLENHTVEFGVGPASQEPVQFHGQAKVHILRPGFRTTNLPVPLVVDINTLHTRI